MSEHDLDSDKEIEPILEPETKDDEPTVDLEAGSPEAALLQAQKQAEDFKDQALRAKAETENIRRRTVREVEHAHKFALEGFSKALLPVIDSLEKTVESVSANPSEVNADALAEGVSLSLKLFQEAMQKAGIEVIDPLGEPFNPEFHEAMSMVDAPDAEPNSVVNVLQKGYVLNGRLIRPAMVVVAKAP